ncbi:hypothetical protein V1514DRAFT_328719 [Lipomyces japonicus]|uniref:uncharacterized protein n=1 Tax=Lipomyces japonicus TaxID=56871 RepID=UPI0034CE5FDD
MVSKLEENIKSPNGKLSNGLKISNNFAKRKLDAINGGGSQHGGRRQASGSKNGSDTATTPAVTAAAAAAAESFGCVHVKHMLSSSSKDMAIKSYTQAVRVALELRDKTRDLSAFRVRRCRICHDCLTTTFLCLQCPFVGCRTNKHHDTHAREAGHMFGIDSRSGNIFCFVCKDYVYNSTLENIRLGREDITEAKKLRKLLNQNGLSTEDKFLTEHNTRLPPCQARTGLRGFQNMGATCFMSVILQCLIHNPIIRNDFLSGGHNSKNCRRENCLGCRIDEVFTEFFVSPTTTGFGPAMLLTTAWKTQRSLAGYSEQDAHEFLQFMLDQLHATSDVNNSSLMHDDECGCIVHRTFCGQLQSDIICPNCDNMTGTVDPLMDLSLELRDRKAGNRILSLQECLEKFTSPEKLETMYNCSFCKSKQLVTKRLSIKRLPLVLSIQLKRFEHALKSNKIDDHVPFPTELNMTSYTTSSASSSSSSNNLRKAYIYELFGVVCHQGKINTGHYTCSMKNRDGVWFSFDDAMVTLSNEDQVLSSRAYLLFYIIKDLA